MSKLKIEEENIESMDIDQKLILAIKEQACTLSDTRIEEYIYHSIESVLLVAIFGIMARCNTFIKIYYFMLKHSVWLDKHIKFDLGLPSLSTIKRVNIENCIIVFDAVNTQIKTIEYITKNHGFYVASVKGNQPTLEENIQLFFADEYNYKKKL